jgi:excisionase family DNA binding protein
MHDRFLKLKEVQAMLSVSRSTVWRWCAERGLKVVRVGDVTRIRESDLQAFLKRHETDSVQEGCSGVPKAHQLQACKNRA